MFMVITFIHMYLCLIFRALMAHASVSPEEREKLGTITSIILWYKNSED